MTNAIDLDSAFKIFLETPNNWLSDEVKSDRNVVEAIKNRSTPARERKLRQWLESYSVLMGFDSKHRDAACETILRFADSRDSSCTHLSKAEIPIAFRQLEEQLSRVAPVSRDGKPRSVISLCSKALWCCFPDSVPIYDRNAVVSLTVLARLLNTRISEHIDEYEQFVDVWLQIYDRMEPLLQNDQAMEQHGYRTRVLDRFLWYLGDPKLRPVSSGENA